MKKPPNLKQEIEKYLDYVIIVEGNKDLLSLQSLGFQKVFTLHENSVSLKERLEQIANQINKKDKICILTDLDKKGRKLYLKAKSILSEMPVHLDSSLRSVLLKAQISHIEGLSTYILNNEDDL